MKAIYRGVITQVTDWCPNPGETDLHDVARGLGATADELATVETEADAWTITADLWDADGVILDHELWVSWMDLRLIVDPTDAQVDAARRGRPIPIDPDALRQAIEWTRNDPVGVRVAASVMRRRSRPPGDVTTLGREGGPP